MVSTLAGSGTGTWADGLGAAAHFSEPHGVSVDSNGALYVADSTNHRIRKISSSGVRAYLLCNLCIRRIVFRLNGANFCLGRGFGISDVGQLHLHIMDD